MVNEIIIEEDGIRAVSSNPTDTLIIDSKNKTYLYTFPDATESFWHKIFVNEDCEITFNILPAGSDNTYNYFLYEDTKDISTEDVLSNTVHPSRANLFVGKMYLTGTGLSSASCVSVENSCSNDKAKDTYRTPYHSAVHAKKGEVLLVNIYHVRGKDCGYTFTLNANEHSQKFQTVYTSCYSKQIASGKVERVVEVNPVKKLSVKKDTAKKIAPGHIEAKAIFLVRDSLKHLSIESEIAFSKNQKDIAQNISMKEKGKYELILQKNMNYHFSFSAIGYKSFDVFFVTTDSLRSFTNEVYLSPLKEGENFVMDKIYFQPNTYHLKEGAQEEIDKLFSYLKANPATSIEIQGHTNGNKRIKGSYKSDFKGSAKKLSQFRADKIKKYLVDKGIPEDRLSAIGYGGSKPIFSSPKNQAQANKNIRVEILILSQKESLSAQKKSR